MTSSPTCNFSLRYFVTKYDVEKKPQYSIATLLDPRFKAAAFSTKVNAALVKQILIDEICTRIQSSPPQVPVTDVSINSDDPSIVQSSGSTWAAILDSTSQSEEDDEFEENSEKIRREANRYLKDSRVDLSFQPLVYWKANKQSYLNLAECSRKYLSAPASSAAPERLFSTAGHILKLNRLSLKPTNFEGCLFLKKNIGTFGDDFGPCPNEFEAPNKEDCPPSELCTEDYSDSECSDIVISSDDES